MTGSSVIYFRLLRPRQWLKNLILFFPPLLGGVLFNDSALIKGLAPFFAFCLASSASYVFNDIIDCEKDRHHPEKRSRPLASGAIKRKPAAILTVILLLISLSFSALYSTSFFLWVSAYLALSFAYSLILKNLPVFDIFCIAAGFVLRLFAGGAAFDVRISDWLFLSVMLLALFLSAGKRLAEKKNLGDSSGNHRKSLSAYPEGVLDGFMYMTGAAVLVTYTMYAITMQRLVFTVPLCCFGLFRYVMLVKGGSSGDPTDSLVKDPVLFVVGLSWVLMVGWSSF